MLDGGFLDRHALFYCLLVGALEGRQYLLGSGPGDLAMGLEHQLAELGIDQGSEKFPSPVL